MKIHQGLSESRIRSSGRPPSFGYLGQQWQCPVPAREGNDIAWTFPWSSSGPFGEDTHGEWKSAEGILVDIKAYWDNPGRDANVHGWYDLHARLEVS